MRNLTLTLIVFFIAALSYGQTIKTVNVTPGNLNSALTSTELNEITNLILTGSIDARDFKTMRDNMPLLAEIDLSDVTVVEYNGTEGTAGSGSFTYPADAIPVNAMQNNIPFSDGKLITIIFSTSIKTIGQNAFYNCNRLTSINIPISVTSIGQGAFVNCKGPISVDGNNPNYSSIDGVLFNKNHTELIQCFISKTGSYSIPFGVTSIGYMAFLYCPLNSVTIPTSVISIENSAFWGCINLTSITLPSSVTSIGEWAFSETPQLTTVIIPSSVAFIGHDAFGYCPGLTSITVAWETPLDISSSSNVFGAMDKTSCILYVPIGSKTAYQSANQWQDFENIVEIQSTIEVTAGNLKTTLGEQLTTITSLALTGSIDARDFKTMRDDMPLLSELDLSNITIVAYTGTEGTSLWGNTNYLENAISEYAFSNGNSQGKTSLSYVDLPLSLTSIMEGAFNSCNGLLSISFPPSLTSIGYAAFHRCEGLTSLNLHEGLATIGDAAFHRCINIATISIPSTVTYIGGLSLGFSSYIIVDENNINYSSNEGVLFNKTQTSLLQYYNSNVDNYQIPNSVTSIGPYAFYLCEGLTTVSIPSSVTSIGFESFAYCRGLTSISIPSSVNTIDHQAFNSCTNLKSIYSLSISPVDLNSSVNVFNDIDKTTCILTVPYGSTAAYQAANQWQDFENIVEMPGLNLSATSVNVGYAVGNTGSIDISSNTTWSVSSDQSWLSVSPNSGSENGTITFTATLNSSTETRIATVTISGEGVEDQIVNVTQSFNNPPVANAGPDQYVAKGVIVTLDGSASFDYDNEPITYQWTAPTGIKLSSDIAVQPTFTAPKGNISTPLSFSLIVNDGMFDSQLDEVIINVADINNPPEVICNNITISLTEDGTYSLTQTDLENIAFSTTDDNDSFNKLIITAEPSNFSCDDVGNSTPVTVSVTDQNGASSSCEATISVIDDIGPIFSKKSYNERVVIPSDQTYTLPDYSLQFSALDNCGFITYSQSPAPGEIYSASTKEEISLIATDNFGNSTETIIKLTLVLKNLKSAEVAPIIETPVNNEFKVYPNPFKERIYFELKLKEDANVSLELFDMTGSKIETIFNGFIEDTEFVNFEYAPDKIATQLVFYKLVVGKEKFSGILIFEE